MIGRFGNAEVFSFHATKFFNTFEGGAVVTNDDDLAKKIRLMKNFGFSGYDNVIYIGTNGKMNEVSAAMGLTSLESIEEIIQHQYENYKQYQRGLEGVPGLYLIDYTESERRNYQYMVLEVDGQATKINRDELIEILHAENILARRYFYPSCHRMEPYRSYLPHAGLLLPNTERLAERVMSLPTGSTIGRSEIDKICQILRLVVENGSEVSHKMRKREGKKDSSAGYPAKDSRQGHPDLSSVTI